jgi:hypothetical protein
MIVFIYNKMIYNSIMRIVHKYLVKTRLVIALHSPGINMAKITIDALSHYKNMSHDLSSAIWFVIRSKIIFLCTIYFTRPRSTVNDRSLCFSQRVLAVPVKKHLT